MPQFSSAGDLERLKMTETTRLKATDLRIQEFEVKARRKGGDPIADRLNEIAQAARQAQPASAGLQLGAFDTDFGIVAGGLDDRPEAPLLREARGQISQQKFREALATLARVFEIAPGHHEATFLKALCQHETKHSPEALRTLAELSGAAVSPRLSARVANLKVEIRGRMLPAATKLYVSAVRNKTPDEALQSIQEYANLDAPVGKYHYFLGGLLVIARRMEDAMQALDHGLSVCESDRDELLELKSEVEQRVLTKVLGPARDLFRQKRYVEAKEILKDVSAECRKLSLWKTFDGYLEELGGRGGGLLSRLFGKKGESAAPGSVRDTEALYDFLVRKEMQAAQKALEGGEHSAAEASLKSALSFTPRFAMANHLYATCVYQRVGGTVKGFLDTDLDEAKAGTLRRCANELEAVRDPAEAGRGDPEIADAPRLVVSLNELIKRLEGVLKDYEVRQKDAKLVNGAVQDFIGVLLLILSGIDSRPKFFEIHRRMQKLGGDIPRLKSQCSGAEARKVMDALFSFVRPNLDALEEIRRRIG